MYTIKYALHTIVRNRGRYALFGAVLVLLLAISTVNLTLGLSANSLCETIKQEYGTLMRLVATGSAVDALKLDDYAAFSDGDMLEQTEVRSAVFCTNAGALTQTDDSPVSGMRIWHVGINEEYQNLFTRSIDRAVLLEGRLPEREHEVAVSDACLAFLQGKNITTGIGDTITQRFRKKPVQVDGKRMWEYDYRTYTLVGIVEEESLDARYRMIPEHQKFVFFLPYDEVCESLEAQEDLMLLYDTPHFDPEVELAQGYEVVYRLKRYTDIDRFAAYAEAVLYGDYTEALGYTEDADGLALMKRRMDNLDRIEHGLIAEPLMPEINQLIPPLEQMQTFTSITTATLAILAAATVAMMCIINMRERKYELGVLRCVGMERQHIVLMLGMESTAFLLPAAGLGLALGMGIFALSGELLLDLQVVGTAIDTARIAKSVALWLIGDVFALAVFATILSAYFVMRTRPLAILRNRT